MFVTSDPNIQEVHMAFRWTDMLLMHGYIADPRLARQLALGSDAADSPPQRDRRSLGTLIALLAAWFRSAAP